MATQGDVKPILPVMQDLTSQCTVSSTYCTGVKVMGNGIINFVVGIAKKGTPDQATLITLPSSIKPSSRFEASVFHMNGVDQGKDATVSILGGGIVQFRASGSIAGDSGILFSIIWFTGM